MKQNWVIDRSTDTLKRDLSNFQSQITNKQTLFTSAQFQNPDFHCKLLNKCHSVFVTDLDVLSLLFLRVSLSLWNECCS